MYCPKCGKEIHRGAWQCEHCGADLRKILREEFWTKSDSEDASESSGSRFKIPEGTVSGIGWRSIHKSRGPAIVLAIIGLVILALLILVLFFSFRGASPKKESAAEAATTVATQTTPPQKITTPPTKPDAAGTVNPKPEAITQTPPSSASATTEATAPSGPITSDEVKSFLQSWLAAWRKTIETKKTDALSAFYSDGFKTASSKDKSAYMSVRLKEAQSTFYANIEIGEPEISVNGAEATAKFTQTYLSDRFSDSGSKTLTIVREGSGLKITSETFQDATPAPQISTDKLKATILDWRKAWEDIAINKKIGDLPSYYHRDFKGSGGKSLDATMTSKLNVAKGFSILAVDIQNLRMSVLGDQAVASFTQVFKSDKFGDKGKKILVFKLEKGRPLITQELFYLQGKVAPIKFEDFWGPQ